jgi:hypothetical protein
MFRWQCTILREPILKPTVSKHVEPNRGVGFKQFVFGVPKVVNHCSDET